MSFSSADGNFESNNFDENNFMTWGPAVNHDFGDFVVVKKVELGDMKISE